MSEAVLGSGRAAAERRMTSTCTIRRLDPNPAHKTQVDGFDTVPWLTAHADLPCRLSVTRGSTAPSRSLAVGQAVVQVAARILNLPVATTDLADGDIVAITSGDASGRFFRLVESTPADQATAMRVQVLEVQQPKGW